MKYDGPVGFFLCARVDFQERIYHLSKGVESLSKEEHGRFFDAVQRLGLSSKVKDAAVALYLDFKNRPAGEYNAHRKNLDIFIIASVSLAAKILGELRTDQEIESKMFVRTEKLVDAEERILRSFGVQDSPVSFSELTLELTKRQIESMAASFREQELINTGQEARLVELCNDHLNTALERGLSVKMSYRGRAAGLVFIAVRDLDLQVSEAEISRAAGFEKKSMLADANIIRTLVDKSSDTERRNSA